MKIAMKTTATAPSANAIGAPENMKSSVTAANARPIASIDMAASGACARRRVRGAPAVEPRRQLDRELQREQRHAGRHQEVGNPERRRPRRRGRLLVDPG